jgi:hypothetical protein
MVLEVFPVGAFAAVRNGGLANLFQRLWSATRHQQEFSNYTESEPLLKHTQEILGPHFRPARAEIEQAAIAQIDAAVHPQG